MTDYNLNVFSPNEFEEFSRDILQEHFKTHIESFKTGKDGGIDLRFSTMPQSNIIIQAKRYKNLSSLLANLEKEKIKVNSLSPDKYIITTTVELSPHNKETIKTMFSPFIKETADIFGKEDLLNLLSQYKNIEYKYYKLWIASTNILQKVLHSKIYNQSQFELDEIQQQLNLYVQNRSFNEASEILDEHRYIIISGIPGIGKTTLSRILTLYLLSSGYEEFVYLSDNISDGYTYFNESKKQIFLFDDFLGKNFFDAVSIQKNDDRIIKFINKIKSSPDKVLILATREYILNQAKEVYEAFKIHDIEIAKCIIDLSTYTNIIKAKILYNHLFHGNIPEEHINNFLENNNYLELINHKNYSPRIIETFINQKIWNRCEPYDFFKVIKSLFDNPESVWLHSFENSLDKFSQYTLLVLLTSGAPILLSDLEKGVQEFFKVNNYKLLLNCDPFTFNRAIRELENTFIKTSADSRNQILVDFQNPSIYDFLINYLKDHDKLINDLIDSFIFTDQFIQIFTERNLSGRITLNEESIKHLQERLFEIEGNINTCKVYTNNTKDGIIYFKDKDYLYKFLNHLNNHYSINSNIVSFIQRNFEPILIFNGSFHKTDYIDLLENLDLYYFQFDEQEIMTNFYQYCNSIDDLEIFNGFKIIFPSNYEQFISTEIFIEKSEEIINSEVNNLDREDASDYKHRMGIVAEYYPALDLLEAMERADLLEAEMDSYIDHQIEMANDREFDDYTYEDRNSDDYTISQIFNSLKE